MALLSTDKGILKRNWNPYMSFAFNTMIGQVTPIALTNIGWKFYIVFVSSTLPQNRLFQELTPVS